MISKRYNENALTDQGEITIWVQFRDKITLEYMHKKEVKRAFLAKAYAEQKVTHAINGIPVIDI